VVIPPVVSARRPDRVAEVSVLAVNTTVVDRSSGAFVRAFAPEAGTGVS
jgi:hypothetical protein